MAATTFRRLADSYLSGRAVSKSYEANVIAIASRCGPVSVESLNGYLKKRLTCVRTTTVRSERTILLSIWRDAYERHEIDEMPRGVMRVRVRRDPTRAWTLEQLRAAVNATFEHDDHHLRSGACRGLLLRCWILLGYETGARFGDLWSFTVHNIDGDVIRWQQAKTGDPITRLLSSGCREACREMLADSPDKRVLGWSCKKRQAMRIMRAFLDANGLPGTSKWLRRSGATHLEIAKPGSAKLHLGHRSVGLAERSYIDWGQVRQNAPVTAELLER